jgi:hypothetical protein
VPNKDDLDYGAVVGAVRFDASRDTSESPWYDEGAKKAWVVGNSLALDWPVKNVRGSQTLMRKLSTHPDWRKILQRLPPELRARAGQTAQKRQKK